MPADFRCWCCVVVVVVLKFSWYFLQTTFKGRVFMTHATKAIYRLLLSDYVKVSKVSVEDMLYDENDIARSMEKIEVCYILITVPFTCLALQCRKQSVAYIHAYLILVFGVLILDSNLPTDKLLRPFI